MYEHNIEPILNKNGLVKLYPSLEGVLKEMIFDRYSIHVEISDNIIKTELPNERIIDIVIKVVDTQEKLTRFGMDDIFISKIIDSDVMRRNFCYVADEPLYRVQWYCKLKYNLYIEYTESEPLENLANIISYRKFYRQQAIVSGVEVYNVITREIDDIMETLNTLDEKTRMALYVSELTKDDPELITRDIIRKVLYDYLVDDKDKVSQYLLMRVLYGLEINNEIEHINIRHRNTANVICKIISTIN